uniref:EH domain-binding protein 1-like n=1 Tax=Fundulus heteroclitus TaxID=8078 RepID=A0A3Q2PKZ3_FUNHE
MTSVWKRLQRVGKKASKFQFVASFQELVVECTEKWQPDKLRVMWIRRSRRHSTKLHSWQPGIKNPYRGMVIWQVPESLHITVTLFKEPGADEFEDKDWTFIIENETKGQRKVLASADVNMKKYATAASAQYDITLKLKPLSVKVVEATLILNLSCIFLKEGKATDEDMQSLASLMSMKQSDIGNLDDFNDSDEEAGEERRASFGTGQSVHVTAPASSCVSAQDLTGRPEGESGPTVNFRMDGKKSSGISSILVVTCHGPLVEPQGPSSPPLFPQTHKQRQSPTQQGQPSTYASSMPAFTHALPPTLPKIFQSTSRAALRRPHSFHSDASDGLVGLSFSTLVPSKARSTSSLSSSPSDPSPHLPAFPDSSQTEFKRQLSTLNEEESQGSASVEASLRTDTSIALEQKKHAPASAGPRAQRDAAKGDTVVKESDTSEVTMEKSGHLSAREPNNLYSIEQMCCDAVEPACARCSEYGDNNMVLQPSPSPFFTETGELLSQTQRAVSPHQAQHSPAMGTMKWQELEVRTSKCPSNREEPPSVTAQETPVTKLIKETDRSSQTVSSSMVLHSDDYEKRKIEKGAGMDDQLPICQIVEKELNILETPSEEYGLQSQGHVKQMEDESSLCPGTCYVPHCPRAESYSKHFTSLDTCSRMTNITGMPCISQSRDEKPGPVNQITISKKQFQSREKRLQRASEQNEKHDKENVLQTQCCPRQAQIAGFPSVSQKSGKHRYSSKLSKKTVTDEDKQSASQWEVLLNKKIETELFTVVVSPKEDRETEQTMASEALKPSYIPNVQTTLTSNEYDTTILSCCPKNSPIEGIPSLVNHNFSERWFTKCKLFTISDPKVRTVTIIDRPCIDLAIKGMTVLAPTCPKQACASGFPSALQRMVIYDGSSGVNLVPSCPSVSNVAGFPSVLKADSKDWEANHESLWEKLLKNKPLLLLQNSTVKKKVQSVCLLQSCPSKSLIPGFPSKAKPRATSMVGLLSLCPKTSQIAGYPSFHSPKLWIINKVPLFEPRIKDNHPLVIDICDSDKRPMKEMVLLSPSCPRVSRIKGFPSVPNPKLEYYTPNGVSLLPLCPVTSSIPGFPSLEQQNKEDWAADISPLIYRSQRTVQFNSDLIPSNTDKAKEGD